MDKKDLNRKLFEVRFFEVENGYEFPNALSKTVMAVDVLNAAGLAQTLLSKKEAKTMFVQEVSCVAFDVDFD